jgi:outer membrane protein
MRVRLVVGWVVILTMVAAIGYAQQPPVPQSVHQLSLAEALETARHNNPSYLTFVADRRPAAARSLSSAVSLFTPTVSVGGGTSWTQAGIYNLQGLQFPTPRTQGLAWNLNFNYLLSGTTIANRGAAAAQLRAADQDIASSATLLETSVRQEYLNLLQARAQADLAQHVVARAQEVLNLAQARYSVGQNTMIDVRQAQVAKGNADVSLLQAQQNVQVEVLKLYQQMGVPAPEGAQVVPTDSFTVMEPRWNQDSLVALALAQNPVLLALRARESAAAWNTRAAYSTYLPSLSFSASYGKFSQTSFDTLGTSTKTTGTSPWNLRLGLSLPIYDAFSRRTQVAQARAQQDDLRYSIRAQELQVTQAVNAAYLVLMTAYQTIGVQANNRAAADEALSLATERYRVGSGDIIQLLNARVDAETAGVNYINAVYDYHKAIAALEQAVGRTLR